MYSLFNYVHGLRRSYSVREMVPHYHFIQQLELNIDNMIKSVFTGEGIIFISNSITPRGHPSRTYKQYRENATRSSVPSDCSISVSLGMATGSGHCYNIIPLFLLHSGSLSLISTSVLPICLRINAYIICVALPGYCCLNLSMEIFGYY